MVETLRGSIGHYIFASSTVIYSAAKVLRISEHHPLTGQPPDGHNDHDNQTSVRPLKLCPLCDDRRVA
jgi:hypothetical protein